ncbi:MAG: VacJ family lipoprotein [Acetobacteraceae bacterium]|nr:VacJ family lipoprotein [Acetobacteraceae bacterium]
MQRPAPLLAAALGLLLAACATRPPADDPDAVAEFRQNNDPAEPFNRAMLDVHQGIDRAVLIPVARGYRAVVPQPVREGIRNVLGNLRTPVILVNDMLQGEPRRAGDTLGRFVINTTLGLGGIFDVAATRFDVHGHTEDFGQTFARWGIGEGPYLFIPILGPSNPRDLTGSVADVAADPLTWFGQGVAVNALTGSRAGLTVVHTRETLLDPLERLERDSLDYYATLRSIYRQRRQAEIANRLDGAAGAAASGTGFGVGNQGR